MEAIGQVGGLWRYPVKSLFGETMVEALLDETGIVGDRRWALRSEHAGELINCKALPGLLTIGAAYCQEPEPGLGIAHAQITLPDGRTLMTSDPAAATAISAIAGHPLSLWPLQPASDGDHYRLRRPFTPELTRQRMGLGPDDAYPDFSPYEPEMIEELQYFATPRGSYKDAYPLHIVTSAALATMQERTPGIRAEAHRFRPNLLLDTPDLRGLPELDWTGFDLVIGDVVLHCGQKTVRCLMPGQAQGDLAAEPRMGAALRELAAFNFGSYCFIRQTGRIRVGDTVLLDRRRMLHPVRAVVPPLPDDVRGDPSPPSPTFAPATIVSRREEARDVVTLGLKVDAGSAHPFLPGQHLVLRFTPAGQEKPIIRSYSISSAPGEVLPDGADYTITVKRMGLASAHLHDGIDVGDAVALRWPTGRFFALPGAATPLVLISNGIGITPLFSMMQAVAAANPDRRVIWLHATDNGRTHVFRDRLAALSGTLSQLAPLIIYRRPDPEDIVGVDYHATERVRADQVRGIGDLPDAEIFLCGSPGFMADLRALLLAAGVAESRIFSEYFGSRRGDGASAAGPHVAHTIRFARSGVEGEWPQGDSSLLALAEDLGIPVDSGCRYGSCQACSTPIIGGEVRYDDDQIAPEPGHVLLCCAQPCSDLVIDL